MNAHSLNDFAINFSSPPICKHRYDVHVHRSLRSKLLLLLFYEFSFKVAPLDHTSPDGRVVKNSNQYKYLAILAKQLNMDFYKINQILAFNI